MIRRALIVLLLAPLLAPLPHPEGTRSAPPYGVITIGTPPELVAVMSAGATAWNETGAVEFVVLDTGCGTGDLTICAVAWDVGGGYARAEWCDQEGAMWPASVGVCGPRGIIMVDALDPGMFGPAEACHELGHILGLWYHRDDGLSCMSEPPGTAYPDAIDLANLGLAPAPEAEPVDEAVVALPSTGTGSVAQR